MKQKPEPKLILGTAMWGWSVTKETAFTLLDDYYASGFRDVDTASNYPINRIASDFRAAERILQEWLQAHGVQDMRVTSKVGSVDNMRTPDNNLSKSFLLMNLDYYINIFQSNLAIFMVHWDNREDINEIADTMEVMQQAQRRGLQAGLSGIKFPALYAQLNEAADIPFQIQIKHNILQSDFSRYEAFHHKAGFIHYGINAGGVKLEQALYHSNSNYRIRGGDTNNQHPMIEPIKNMAKTANLILDRAPIRNFNQLAMIFSWYSPSTTGILIGPSSKEQLKETLVFHQDLLDYDYHDVYVATRRVQFNYEQNYGQNSDNQ